MLVTLLGVLGALAVLGVAAVVATRDGGELAPAPPDRPDLLLPDGPLGAADLEAVRFGMVLRGYRMAEVDAVLDRAGDELERLRARVAELERERSSGSAPEPAGP